MKPPEEIKKGLECCTAEINECDSCPYREYNWCEEKLKADALELLVDLFKDREERDDLAEECQNLEQRLAQAEREKEALLHDCRYCDTCVHAEKTPYEPPCNNCQDGSLHEWRGICNENSKEGEANEGRT